MRDRVQSSWLGVSGTAGAPTGGNQVNSAFSNRRRVFRYYGQVNPEPSPNTPERRKHLRFPMRVLAKYRVRGFDRLALTRDIGSHGIFIKTDDDFVVGDSVELSLDWPVGLDGRALQLSATGSVVRCNKDGVAIRLSKYEFWLGGLTLSRSAEPR